MSTRLALFTAWCVLVLAGNAAAAYYAWSPFADGKRGGSSFFYGPSHK